MSYRNKICKNRSQNQRQWSYNKKRRLHNWMMNQPLKQIVPDKTNMQNNLLMSMNETKKKRRRSQSSIRKRKQKFLHNYLKRKKNSNKILQINRKMLHLLHNSRQNSTQSQIPVAQKKESLRMRNNTRAKVNTKLRNLENNHLKDKAVLTSTYKMIMRSDKKFSTENTSDT